MTKKQLPRKIRLRFPPSPTGPLHIGGARTALFNYLFAKKQGGEFVLRIEDTDKERSNQKWTDEIIEELHWLGITWNEGPDIDGPFGPYKQSQRLDTYQTYLEKLLAEKKAYYCICTTKELEEKRQKQSALGQSPKYDAKCRDKNNTTGVIRFRVAEKKVKFSDLIRGQVEFNAGLLGDVVIAKNLKSPLYHFAVVVDDFQMQISHVIRGEEHLSNTPRQMLLQEALGFYQPTYAHVPLLLNPDKSKMSKRVGDVAVSDYHHSGYLPEALINFMAMLGWNPGTEKEIFSLKELEKEFSLEKVQRGGAVFNVQKLDYINGLYLREKSNPALLKLCLPYLKNFDLKQYSKNQLEKIIETHKARMKKLSDITALTDFFFAQKLDYDKKILAWANMESGEVKVALEQCAKLLAHSEKFDKKSLEELLVPEAESFNPKSRGFLLWPLRVALSGKEASAGPFEIAEILGKEKTLQRVQDAIDKV